METPCFVGDHGSPRTLLYDCNLALSKFLSFVRLAPPVIKVKTSTKAILALTESQHRWYYLLAMKEATLNGLMVGVSPPRGFVGRVSGRTTHTLTFLLMSKKNLNSGCFEKKVKKIFGFFGLVV